MANLQGHIEAGLSSLEREAIDAYAVDYERYVAGARLI